MNCWANHIDDHFLVFNDVHVMLSAMGSKKYGLGEKLLSSMQDFSKNTDSDFVQVTVTKSVGLDLATAIQHWGSEKYEDVVKTMLPKRHLYQSIGGSHAQRDLLNQLLINSAVKSKKLDVASSLLSERLEIKPKQAQAWKLYSNILKDLNQPDFAKSCFEKYKSLL